MSIIIAIFTALISTLLISAVTYYVLGFTKSKLIRISNPVIENPYGNQDYVRNLPLKVRFLRVAVRPRFFHLKNTRATLVIKDHKGRLYDSTGILHWQRQPRSGIPHPLQLHKDIKNEEDLIRHMVMYHFAHNKPIDIRSNNTEKIDLLLRVEGVSKAITTVSRENRISPGSYILDLSFDADNISKTIARTFHIYIGSDLEDVRILKNSEIDQLNPEAELATTNSNLVMDQPMNNNT
ncbi:hypothetical protein [Poriferisphaera sp. WC338]|uniref:hypothetical protein n=1 Tax=Poriferisphaera sp. WC338 TaxID=3425129 RepID=UPI003D813BF1